MSLEQPDSELEKKCLELKDIVNYTSSSQDLQKIIEFLKKLQNAEVFILEPIFKQFIECHKTNGGIQKLKKCLESNNQPALLSIAIFKSTISVLDREYLQIDIKNQISTFLRNSRLFQNNDEIPEKHTGLIEIGNFIDNPTNSPQSLGNFIKEVKTTTSKHLKAGQTFCGFFKHWLGRNSLVQQFYELFKNCLPQNNASLRMLLNGMKKLNQAWDLKINALPVNPRIYFNHK
jgi:hypothetical protein